jgi:2'-5' RNA ligase
VLTESVENAPLHQLHHTLAAALALYDHSRRKKFTPHLTLLYDHRSVPEQQIEPVSWVVREIVLVDSWVGQTKHVVHVRWPLRD